MAILGPKWDILNWDLKTVRYFLTDITEYDLRNTFAHMKAGVATEEEVSDWQTHFCCAAAAASTLPIPPRAIEKLIASHFADPQTAFFLPLKQRKKVKMQPLFSPCLQKSNWPPTPPFEHCTQSPSFCPKITLHGTLRKLRVTRFLQIRVCWMVSTEIFKIYFWGKKWG